MFQVIQYSKNHPNSKVFHQYKLSYQSSPPSMAQKIEKAKLFPTNQTGFDVLYFMTNRRWQGRYLQFAIFALGGGGGGGQIKAERVIAQINKAFFFLTSISHFCIDQFSVWNACDKNARKKKDWNNLEPILTRMLAHWLQNMMKVKQVK